MQEMHIEFECSQILIRKQKYFSHVDIAESNIQISNEVNKGDQW
jgi:hypothetical protein